MTFMMNFKDRPRYEQLISKLQEEIIKKVLVGPHKFEWINQNNMLLPLKHATHNSSKGSNQ